MSEHNVILTWSGSMAHKVASALYDWLPEVIPNLKPWISSEDIAKGTPWYGNLMGQLEHTKKCIICVTPENVGSPWIFYEAGAVAVKGGTANICPYLVGVAGEEISDTPLGQVQWTKAEGDDTWRLVRDLNKSLPVPHGEKLIRNAFKNQWPKLSKKLGKILGNASKDVTMLAEELSPEAKRILSEAARDTNGMLLMGNTMDGFFMNTQDGKDLVEQNDARGEARARAAMDELADKNLMAPYGPSDEIFRVTEQGYAVADEMAGEQPPIKNDGATLDDNDLLSMLETWLSKRSDAQNAEVIHFAKLDEELRFPAGSAERLLEQAGKKHRLRVQRKGANTLQFEPRSLMTSEAPIVSKPKRI
jgi:TIR domain